MDYEVGSCFGIWDKYAKHIYMGACVCKLAIIKIGERIRGKR